MTSKTDSPPGIFPSLSIIGIKLSVYFLLFFMLFRDSYTQMVSWWKRDDYNYSVLVPFVVFYLVWEKRKSLAQTVSSPSWYGLVPFAGGVALYFLGELGGEYTMLQLSSWFMLVGLLWMHLGWKRLKIISFPVAFLLTMIPLPSFLFKKVTLGLQLISSKLGVYLIHLYGLSAYREGNIIDLGFTRLQVVEACSGLRFLIPLFVLSILLAYFFRASILKRLIIVASSIPLAIITNSLRIALTGILFKHFGKEAAEGFFHGFSGWFIFMFSLLFLVGEMWILGRMKPGLRPGVKKDDTINDAFQKLPRPESPGGVLRPPHFIVASLILLGMVSLFHGVEFREKTPLKKSFESFPLALDGYSGQRRAMEEKFISVLDLSDYLIVDYHDGRGRVVNLYVAYYESQRKGESIHSPESCLPGSGWEFRETGVRSFKNGSKAVQVNSAVMEMGDEKQLVFFWFPARGRILTNIYQLKIFTFWDALTRQRTDGALVRIITRVYPDEDLSDADKRLKSFTEKILPLLDEYLPG